MRSGQFAPAAVVSLSAALPVQAPAIAAMDSNCYLSTPNVTTDGVYAYYTSTVTC